MWVYEYSTIEMPKCLRGLKKVEGTSFFILMNVVIDAKYLGFAVGSQMLP